MAFLAFPEAFGVPIAQLQNQGALIASPLRNLAKRHALLPAGSVFQPDASFTENFIFYADEEDLVPQLRDRADRTNSMAVAQCLRERQPQLVCGDTLELRRAIAFAQHLAHPH